MISHCLSGVILVVVLCMGNPQDPSPQWGRIQGTVVDSQGTAVAGARVYATNIDRPLPSRARYFMSDEDGGFVIERVHPGRNLAVAFKENEGYPDKIFSFFSLGDESDPPIVTVEAGKIVEGIRLNLGEKAGKLKVYVYDQTSARPIENFRVRVSRAEDAEVTLQNSIVRGSTDQSGQVTQLVPAPMGYRVNVSAEHYHDGHFVDDNTDVIFMEPGETREVSVGLVPK